MIYLQITDIERLAKAGVSVKIGMGDDCVCPQKDDAPPPSDQYNEGMTGSIWQRWHRRKHSAAHGKYSDPYVTPFQLLATTHGDKVWVSLHPHASNYEPVQFVDDVAIFPSDALMANIALWEREHP